MTFVKHTQIERATFEFVNRDGVPTKLVVDPPAESGADVDFFLTPSGSVARVEFRSGEFPNNGENYRYLSNEEDPPAVITVGAPTAVKPMGKVGVFCWSVVGLAILVPFLGILWAWSAGVVRSLGGLW